MESKTLYYIEFINKKVDLPYVMQTTTFESPRKAMNWFLKYFDFVEENGGIRVFIMTMDFINEDEYEIGTYCEIVDRRMKFYK